MLQRCQHSVSLSSSVSSPCGAPYLICSALVPNTRALSYFVMYGVVVRLSFAILFSFKPFTPIEPFAVAPLGSPDVTTLPCIC